VLVTHPGRAAGGQAARAKAGLVTHHGSGTASSRDPGRPGVPGIFTGAAGGLLAAHLPGLSETAAVAVLMTAMAMPAG